MCDILVHYAAGTKPSSTILSTDAEHRDSVGRDSSSGAMIRPRTRCAATTVIIERARVDPVGSSTCDSGSVRPVGRQKRSVASAIRITLCRTTARHL